MQGTNVHHPSAAIAFLRERGLSDYKIGERAKLPQSTVFRIRTGATPSPQWKTAEALVRAAEAEGFGGRVRRRVNAAK